MPSDFLAQAPRILAQPVRLIIMALVLLISLALAPLALAYYDAPPEAQSGDEIVCAEKVCRVDVRNFEFKPFTLRIAPGTTVIWENFDSAPHTITAGEPGSPTGQFDSGSLSRGDSFEFTFNEAMEVREFVYYCAIHPWMRGKVIVDPAVPEFPLPSLILVLAMTMGLLMVALRLRTLGLPRLGQ